MDDGPLKALNDALHTFHLWAGRPSLTEMYAALSDEAKKKISRSTLHAALTGTALPRRDTVDALVEILGARARNTTPEEQLLRFDKLWQRAAAGEISANALGGAALPVDVPGAGPDLPALVARYMGSRPGEDRLTFVLLLMEALKGGPESERQDRASDLFRFLVTRDRDRRRQLPPGAAPDAFDLPAASDDVDASIPSAESGESDESDGHYYDDDVIDAEIVD
ncbi:hypothetical protein [Streptomyces sp. NPDC014894]|uniref:hypothetical protein n=1 Tax=unclassified Streptomyces TaxID=2593676 RepID=UPI0036FFDD78